MITISSFITPFQVKTNLPLCLIEPHTTKLYENVELRLRVFLTSVLYGRVGGSHVSW